MGGNPWGGRNIVITVDAETVQNETQTERRWTSKHRGRTEEALGDKEGGGEESGSVEGGEDWQEGKTEVVEGAGSGGILRAVADTRLGAALPYQFRSIRDET